MTRDPVAASAPVGSDPCSVEESSNDDRDHATPYTLGTTFHACLQADEDVDYYQFTAPAQTGVVSVHVTDVAPDLVAEFNAGVAADNGTVLDAYSPSASAGESVSGWFAVQAGTPYRIWVHAYVGGSHHSKYTLEADFTPVVDVNEPNDTRDQATPITAGAAVHGYLLSGYAEGKTLAPWQDWFKVTLAAGSATFSLQDLPTNTAAEFWVYDPDGNVIADQWDQTSGANLSATKTVTAGAFLIQIGTFSSSGPPGSGGGSALPENATKAYTLTVSQ